MQPSRPTSAIRRLLPAVLLTGGGGAFLAEMQPTPGFPGEDVVRQAPVSLVPSPGSQASVAEMTLTTTPTRLPSALDPTVAPPQVAPVAPAAPVIVVAGPVETVPTSAVPPAPTCNEAVDGPIIDTRWGPVQVSASVSPAGTLICDVNAPVTPTDHRKSVRINDRAVPLLNDFAMFTQGAVFDSVSGATITSRAYKQSLQAILDGTGT